MQESPYPQTMIKRRSVFRALASCCIPSLIAIIAISTAEAQGIALPSPARTWTSPGHTRYYVDSVAGNDANDGKSASQPWQTLDNINSGNFAPGDWIFLKCGSRLNSFFAPGGSGGNRHPVKVTSYGSGAKPQIDAHGKSLASLSLHNQEYWDVENIDITNTTTSPIPLLRGVEVSLLDYGTAHDIVLRNLDIHDTTSPEDKWNGGSGIFCDNRGDKVNSRYDGLLIEDCHLTHTDRNGITMDSGYYDRTKWYPNLHVVIRGNTLLHIGGDCICAIGCDGCLIERNVVHGGRERATDWASGIWVWSCDNSIIQYNECSGMMGQMDAQGFDADWNTQNTIIQYNYSHDNHGGFVMMCDNGDVKPPGNIGNIGTIVRYNISQNDGFRTFTFSGPDKNELIYNNTIYIGKTDNTILFFTWNWGGNWPDNTTFWNNIFYCDGSAVFQLNGSTNTNLSNNLFYGNFTNTPADPHAIKANPLLKSPGSGGNGFETLDGYELQRGSPCANAGIAVVNNGGTDFYGKSVPDNKPPFVGASQK
jgi:hypothetical protein